MTAENVKAAIFMILTAMNMMAAFLVWRGKDKATFYLGWSFFFAGVLCFSWGGVYYFHDYKLLWSRAHWLGGLMGTYYLLFTYYFTGHTRWIRWKIFFWNALGLSIAGLSLFTPYFFVSISPNYPYLTPDSPGVLSLPLGRGFSLVGSLFILYYLINSYRRETGFKKWQLKYFIWGISVMAVATFILSGLIPALASIFNWQNFNFPMMNEVTGYFTVFVVFSTFYAIFKNKLFDIKVILTELLVGVVSLVLLIQIFLAPNLKSQIIAAGVLVMFLISGYLLIRATNKEIEKEAQARALAVQLEELNANLEKLVEEKTRQLRDKVEELGQAQKALINILEDNTEAREKTEEEKNKTLAIIANFTDPLIVLDRENKLSMINPAAVKVFNLSQSDLGTPVSRGGNFSIANFKAAIKKDFQIKTLDDQPNKDGFIAEEITIKIDDQEATYKVLTAKILSAAGEPLGAMKIFYDLTREKTIDRMKSEFISIAAHQLRTPLSAIKWVIKMILDGDAGQLNLEQQELLSKGYASNERIIKLVNDLLNVSRIEEGRFGFDFKPTDFSEVVNTAVSNLGELAAKNHQQIIVAKPDNLPPVYLDKDRMIMVMQNLLDNALKYSPEHAKVEITIGFDNQFLHVKIKDHGVGIPKDGQAKLFSKFFRAANAVKLDTEGSGLGLFIVKNIIDKHSGRVSLTSEEGKGTEVDFSLPLNARTS